MAKELTLKDAKAAGLVEMSEADYVSTKIPTTQGEMTWAEWCKREVQRLREAGRKADIVETGNKWAVWVSPLPPLPPRPVLPPSG